MNKTILITGSTDGLGLATGHKLAALGHNVILHGRNAEKLQQAQAELEGLGHLGKVFGYVADLSNMTNVEALANTVIDNHPRLDVLINNAGVFKVPSTRTSDGLDVRIAVNTLAPYLLGRLLLPVMSNQGRVVNLSSAAQSPIDLSFISGDLEVSDDFSAYAQSKLALTMWSQQLGNTRSGDAPSNIAVNPGSLLATKMVKDGFNTSGNDLGIGVDILTRAALSDEFDAASGRYFDNDKGQFSAPHIDAANPAKVSAVVDTVERVIAGLTS